jgi:hypothetical protein
MLSSHANTIDACGACRRRKGISWLVGSGRVPREGAAGFPRGDFMLSSHETAADDGASRREGGT